MSTKKKTRSPKSKVADCAVAAEGIYSNSYFMNSVVALVGSSVKVHTASGSVYEGILKTFSPQFDVVVELAHKVEPCHSAQLCMESVVGKMVFKQQGIVKIAVIDQDLDYATRDKFQTDAAISRYNGQVGEKVLEPWDSTTAVVEDNDFDLDTSETANGWDVNDMFRQNEEVFGVTSNFDHGLAGYTTRLQTESKDYKEAEARASKIANEIENTSYYKSRIELENGDEEEKFASVVRPNRSEEGPSNKYVPPPKRKISSQVSSKAARTSSSSPTNSIPPPPHHQSSGKVATTVPSSPNPPVALTPVNSVPMHSGPACSSSNGGRVNGGGGGPLFESPKPQRVTSNVRHGRNFGGSNESSRSTSNGSISSPTSTISSASSSTTTTNHSEQVPPPQHHRSPLPGPSYGAPHAPILQSQIVVNPGGDHKQHNSTYGVVHNNMSVSTGPSQHGEQQHLRSGPYNQQNSEYRGPSSVHYAHNSISPGPNVPSEQQYMGGPRGGQHYGGGHPMASSSNDPRGGPHYGHPITYAVPIMTSGGGVVEIRGQPPPPNEGPDGQQQLMGQQPPIVHNQIHYRKPPIVTQHTVVDHGGQGVMSHKAARRRKEISELKAFSQDYKLADPDDVGAPMAVKRCPEDELSNKGRMHDGLPDLQRPASSSKQEPPKVVKSNLNPNAKEFVYNPSKQYTPAMSTPSQSRPHTPQTPAAGYAPMPPQAPLGHPISMMMPTYVVTTAQPPYPQPPSQQARYPKVHMNVASEQLSQMQVAAATGQPLLAPAPLPQFAVTYPPHNYIPQPYQQMMRMVQTRDTIATFNFPGPEAPPQAAPMPFMAAPPPHPPPAQHPQHPPMLHHTPQNNASSPQSNGNNQMAYHRLTPRGW